MAISMWEFIGYFPLELMLYPTHKQPPAMGTFGASNTTVAATLGDRVAPMASMVALVSIFCLHMEENILCGAPRYFLLPHLSCINHG